MPVLEAEETIPFAEDNKARVIGTKRANDSKPKGDHHVFMHCPDDPNGDVGQVTKTTGASRPLKRADGISPPTSFGTLITADTSS